MLESVIFIAFLWGTASAVSLPLGAGLGLAWKPRQKANSAFMAFGAGALLFALTIELFGHVPHHVAQHGFGALAAAIGGALMGGCMFDWLNSWLNKRGAFMRKLSSAKRYVASIKMKRAKKLLKGLSKIGSLEKLPPEQIARLIQKVEEIGIYGEKPIFEQGDPADGMYFIISGKIDIIVHEAGQPDKVIATLGAGETFGEMGIILDSPRTADAIPRGDLRLYRLGRKEFDEMSKDLPELRAELTHLTEKRLTQLSARSSDKTRDAWFKETINCLHQDHMGVTFDEIKKEGHHAGGENAAMAIWLGILIDGIPESLIIGILALKPGGMSLAFIAGVFLANLPEAMSSAVSMSKGGMKKGKIFMMWGSLCLLTGLGAMAGAFIFPGNPTGAYYYVVLGIEGLAAGAMLTMIAETMLPEASEQGGPIVGISTLLGFIAALLVKIYA